MERTASSTCVEVVVEGRVIGPWCALEEVEATVGCESKLPQEIHRSRRIAVERDGVDLGQPRHVKTQWIREKVERKQDNIDTNRIMHQNVRPER